MMRMDNRLKLLFIATVSLVRMPLALLADGLRDDTTAMAELMPMLRELIRIVWGEAHSNHAFDVLMTCLVSGALALFCRYVGAYLFSREALKFRILSYVSIGTSLILWVYTLKVLVGFGFGDVANWAPETVEGWLKLCAAILAMGLLSMVANFLADWGHFVRVKNITRYYLVVSLIILTYCLIQPFSHPTLKQVEHFYWLQHQVEFLSSETFIENTQEFQKELLRAGSAIIEESRTTAGASRAEEIRRPQY